MNVDAKDFVRQKEHELASKYAKRTLRRVISLNATSAKDQLDDIERAYRKFIDVPLGVSDKT